MSGSAMWAVARERLRAERRTIEYACAAAAIVAFVQPHGIARMMDPFDADLAARNVWLAGPMFFCSLIGISVALMQGPGRHVALDACERSAPLFGRELARGKALAPCIVVALASLTYWGVEWIAGFAAPPTFFVLALAAAEASTLVALLGSANAGASRSFYGLLAFATTALAYFSAVYIDAIGPKPVALGHYNDVIGVSVELTFCLVAGFVALRQYGEALAT